MAGEGGFESISAQTMDQFIALSRTAEFKKAVTTANGPQAYDLEAEVKSLFPVITPIRNEIPRVFSKQRGDVATHWQAITAINTLVMPPVVNEGRRGGSVTSNFTKQLAAYATLGLEDSVTEEARLASMGYDDIDARTVANLIWAMYQQEELTYIGGNNSLLFGTTPTPTLTQTAGASSFSNPNVVSVIVVALSLEGYNRALKNSGTPVPVVTRTVVGSTLAAGPVVESLPGGVAQKSANATITISVTGNTVGATVAVVPGAVAYAWFAGVVAGNETLVGLSTINSIVISAAGAGVNASTMPAADNSAYNNNPIGIDGIMTLVQKTGSGAAITTQATGTVGVGTPLTSHGIAILEIDNTLKSMWNSNNVSPDTIWCNAQQLTDISDKIFAAGGAALTRFAMDMNGVKDAQSLKLSAGAVVGTYLNRFTMGGPTNIEVRLHLNIPNGTIMLTSKRLPFPNSNVPDVLRVRGQVDYHEIVWGPFTRSAEYGVYMRATLQCYFVPAFALITNVAAG